MVSELGLDSIVSSTTVSAPAGFYSSPPIDASINEVSIHYGLGIPASGPVGANFALCWGKAPTPGVSPSQYRVSVGSVAIAGPQAAAYTCRIGWPCKLEVKTSHGLSAENSLIVVMETETCGAGTATEDVGALAPFLTDQGISQIAPVSAEPSRFELGTIGERDDDFVRLYGFRTYKLCWASSYNGTLAAANAVAVQEGITNPNSTIASQQAQFEASLLASHSVFFGFLTLNISSITTESGVGIGLGRLERFSVAAAKDIYITARSATLEWTVSSGEKSSKLLSVDFFGTMFANWDNSPAQEDPRYSQAGTFLFAVDPASYADANAALAMFGKVAGVRRSLESVVYTGATTVGLENMLIPGTAFALLAENGNVE